jgi:hypothetical protein
MGQLKGQLRVESWWLGQSPLAPEATKRLDSPWPGSTYFQYLLIQG